MAVLGDCKETLAAVTALLEKKEHTEWRESFRQYDEQESRIVIEPQIHPTSGPLRMGEVVRRVTELTADKAVLVTDVGQNQMMAARYFRFSQKRSIIPLVVWVRWASDCPQLLVPRLALPTAQSASS